MDQPGACKFAPCSPQKLPAFACHLSLAFALSARINPLRGLSLAAAPLTVANQPRSDEGLELLSNQDVDSPSGKCGKGLACAFCMPLSACHSCGHCFVARRFPALLDKSRRRLALLAGRDATSKPASDQAISRNARKNRATHATHATHATQAARHAGLRVEGCRPFVGQRVLKLSRFAGAAPDTASEDWRAASHAPRPPPRPQNQVGILAVGTARQPARHDRGTGRVAVDYRPAARPTEVVY